LDTGTTTNAKELPLLFKIMSHDTINDDGSDGDSGDDRKRYNIRLRHDGCWMVDVTESNPGAHIIEKAFYHGEESIKTDIVVFVDDNSDADIDETIEEISDHPDVHHLSILNRLGDRARLMIYYDDDHSVNSTIANSDIMPIEPVRAVNGVEHWSVLMVPSDVGSTLTQLEDECDAKIQSIRGFDSTEDIVFTDIIEQINGQLSPRQTESLLVAEENGYYNWPRHASANDIADELGISGPTCLEHLRKGEHKIVRTLIDALQKRHGRTK
jgi:predicted DNA binding protein